MRPVNIKTLVCRHDKYLYQVDETLTESTNYGDLLKVLDDFDSYNFIMVSRLDILLYKLPQITEIYKNSVHKNVIIYAVYNNTTLINFQNWHKAIDLDHEITNSTMDAEVRDLVKAHTRWHKFPVSPSNIVKKQIEKLELYNWIRNKFNLNKEQSKLYNSLPRTPLIGYATEIKNQLMEVNSYDIKSSYPFIMYAFEYPSRAERICYNYPLDKFQKIVDKMWVAEISFEQRPRLKEDALDVFESFLDSTMTLTSTDYWILQDAYDFKIKNINRIMIHFFKKQLPPQLRDFILESFNHKESFPKDSNEYKEAKIALNSIYGLFYPTEERQTSKSLPVVVGAWTCAFGRFRLYEILRQCKYNAVYWDTDGIKTDTDISDIISAANEKYKIPNCKLGQWQLEAEEAEFIAFGKKQYWLNGELTCAGLNKKLANKYLKENNIVPYEGIVIPEDYTGLWYYNENHEEIKITYQIGGGS